MEVKKTITSIFIVPTLSIDKEKLADNGYINGYIKDGKRDVQYDNAIYLLFKPESIGRFAEFLDSEYQRTKQIIDDYDYEGGYVVIVYTLSERLTDDIKLIKQGKYSKTSPRFQEIFPKIVKIKKNGMNKDEISLQYRVFNKTSDLREFWEEKLGVDFDDDMEVWHAFIEENETMDLTKIKEYVQ
jgi:hypothetical protein